MAADAQVEPDGQPCDMDRVILPIIVWHSSDTASTMTCKSRRLSRKRRGVR
jgi:hypothetical protein